MKTIGLIGGMSWESTVTYYQAINREVKNQLGGLHSAKVVMVSVDFAEIEQLQHQGNWQQTAAILAHAAHSLQAAGADFFLICTNTMHKVASEVSNSVDIPLLHIADATAEKLLDDGISTVGLLGTRFTMEQDFYKQRLIEKYDLEVLTPDADERDDIHRVIYEELCLGTIKASSRQRFVDISEHLCENGAQAIILGCTEIGLLLTPDVIDETLYDTTYIHAKAAVKLALADG